MERLLSQSVLSTLARYRIDPEHSRQYFMSFPDTLSCIQGTRQTETRRLGWSRIKRGDILYACESLSNHTGLSRMIYATLFVIDHSWEPLQDITEEGCTREGYEGVSPKDFIKMWCERHKKQAVTPHTLVHRIHFEYVPDPGELYDTYPFRGLGFETEIVVGRNGYNGERHFKLYQF